MRTVVLIDGIELVNAVVVSDGPEGNKTITALKKEHDAAVEVTDMDPQPGLGIGWTYVDGAFVPPPAED